MLHPVTDPKVCALCQSLKDAEQFYTWTDKSGRPYLSSLCKLCIRAGANADRESDPKRFQGYEKKYRDGSRTKVAAGVERWRLRNKEHVRKRNKTFRDTHPEIVRPRYIAAITKKRVSGFDRRLKAIQDANTEALESYRIGDEYWDVYSSELIRKPTIDHIVPLCAGGSPDFDNLCPTSRLNNSSKNSLPLLVWLTLRPPVFLPELRRQEGIAGPTA